MPDKALFDDGYCQHDQIFEISPLWLNFKSLAIYSGLIKNLEKFKTTLTTKIAALGQNLIVFIAKIENIF